MVAVRQRFWPASDVVKNSFVSALKPSHVCAAHAVSVVLFASTPEWCTYPTRQHLLTYWPSFGMSQILADSSASSSQSGPFSPKSVTVQLLSPSPTDSPFNPTPYTAYCKQTVYWAELEVGRGQGGNVPCMICLTQTVPTKTGRCCYPSERARTPTRIVPARLPPH